MTSRPSFEKKKHKKTNVVGNLYKSKSILDKPQELTFYDEYFTYAKKHF